MNSAWNWLHKDMPYYFKLINVIRKLIDGKQTVWWQ